MCVKPRSSQLCILSPNTNVRWKIPQQTRKVRLPNQAKEKSIIVEPAPSSGECSMYVERAPQYGECRMCVERAPACGECNIGVERALSSGECRVCVC